MKRFGLALLSCLLVSATAHGFEAEPAETEGGKSAPHVMTSPGLGLEDQRPPSEGKKAWSGFELPGFGKIGVLPKLDFGLELLYGETPPAARAEGFADRDTEPDDVTIRGTFKHRFCRRCAEEI